MINIFIFKRDEELSRLRLKLSLLQEEEIDRLKIKKAYLESKQDDSGYQYSPSQR